MKRILAALALLAIATGCHSTYTSERSESVSAGVYYSYGTPSYSHERARYAYGQRVEDRPELALNETQIAQVLSRCEARTEARKRHARQLLDRAEPIAVEEVAQRIRDLYHAGEREAAEELASRHAGVATWENADTLVTIEAHYRDCHKRTEACGIEVALHRRPGVEGTIAIAFPPGTYGVGEVVAEGGNDGQHWTNPDDDRRYGHWPSVQDLALLKAPVIVIPAGDEVASVMFPVACASFEKGSPRADMNYSLHRFEKGSNVDRVLLALCAGDQASEPEQQLAVWLARNDISWDQFVSEGGPVGRLVTFGGHFPIRSKNSDGAAKLLLRSGIDPRTTKFFGGESVEQKITSESTPQQQTATPAANPPEATPQETTPAETSPSAIP